MGPCSTACTLPFARPRFTMVLLPVSPPVSSLALWPVSDTAFFATRHTRPTLAAGTEALTQFALTRVLSRPSRYGGLRCRLPLVVSPSCSSTCQVSHRNAIFCVTKLIADITSSLRYRLLACTREHERSCLCDQPPEHRLRLHYQLGSLLRHH